MKNFKVYRIWDNERNDWAAGRNHSVWINAAHAKNACPRLKNKNEKRFVLVEREIIFNENRD